MAECEESGQLYALVYQSSIRSGWTINEKTMGNTSRPTLLLKALDLAVRIRSNQSFRKFSPREEKSSFAVVFPGNDNAVSCESLIEEKKYNFNTLYNRGEPQSHSS